MDGPAREQASFGDLLRGYRSAAGLTQEELAHQSGLSSRAIADLERGRTTQPYRRTVFSLADVLMLSGPAREEFAHSARPRASAGAPPGNHAPDEYAPARQPDLVPRQLPPAISGFVGRAAELEALDRLLGENGPQAQGTPILLITGPAGVGKTATAVRWAHQLSDQYPDGQLYVDLRGYAPGQPMAATSALAGFLRATGMPGQAIPADEDERAARHRSLLAERRILIVLDNARSAEQVRPLLPGTPGCAVVVTSRDDLAGLVARDGAQRVNLDLLPLAEAAHLLRTLIGARASTDPEMAELLAIRCGRLPLALRVGAELASARPTVPLAGLAAELADRQRLLDLLDAGGDSRTAVEAVLSWSYQQLDVSTARMFRLAGLHAGADLDPHAAAALADTTVVQARHLLGLLARAHLIQPGSTDRYTMHDLLRAYACQLTAEDGATAQRAALTRLFDHYLSTAAIAMNALFPAESGSRPRIRPPASLTPAVTSTESAQAWLDAERATLVAVALHTAENGWPGHAIQLSAVLHRYLHTGGHFPEAVAVHGHAHRAARQAGDSAAEARTLRALGVIDLYQGRYEQAARNFRQALALYEQAGNRTGQAYTLGNLGCAELRLEHCQRAIGCFERALALHRQASDQIGEAYALGNLGCAELQLCRCAEAADHIRQALALCQQTGDQTGEAHAWADLGDVDLQRGRINDAHTWYADALSLAIQTGDKHAQAQAYDGLARGYHLTGNSRLASRNWQQSLALFTALGAPEARQIQAHLSAAGT